jgi:hypothetical protein
MTTKAKTHADQMAATLKTLTSQAEAYRVLTLADITTPTDSLSATIGLITPQVALDVLKDHHASNRAMSVASQDAYRDDMLAGRWAFNGQTFVFDTKGKLIDGQHRMAALADTLKYMPGFPGLPFVVVQGVDIAAQETMDAGRKRSVADQLNIGQDAENKLGTKIVSALRALYVLGNAGSGGKLGGGKLTNAVLFDMFRKHKAIVDSVRLVHAKGDAELTISVRPAVVTAIHYMATHLLPKDTGVDFAAKADAFVEVLRTGVPTEGYQGQDPAHALYTRWNQMLATGKRPSENDALKLIALAWELYAAGKASTPKAFVKVPVVLEPVGITRTDVTGEILDLPTSSQPTPEAIAAEKAKGTGNKLPNGMTQKPGETEEQTIARYAAADKATQPKGKPAKGKSVTHTDGSTGKHGTPATEAPKGTEQATA